MREGELNHMIYIISILKNTEGKLLYYKIFDTYSESSMSMTEEVLLNIMLYNKIQVANASIQNNNIAVNDWVNKRILEVNTSGIIKQPEINYIVLAMKGDKYKVVDLEGNIHYKTTGAIRNDIRFSKVANCTPADNNGKLKISAKNTYNIHIDSEFEKLIESQYNNFIAKSNMLGYVNTTFTYEIENHDVRLTKYTGSGQKVILPSFITAIGKEAFQYKNIKRINLNEGLKSIGRKAFNSDDELNSIEAIEIPSTVELIGLGAFRHNYKLFTKMGTAVPTDRFKLRNKQTVIMKQ